MTIPIEAACQKEILFISINDPITTQRERASIKVAKNLKKFILNLVYLKRDLSLRKQRTANVLLSISTILVSDLCNASLIEL
jgi:hypothetical protein